MSTTRIPVERRIGDRYVVRAELAGVDPVADLRVMYGGGGLRLDAVRDERGHPRGARTEFQYGTLFRIIPLPAGVQSRTLKARYANGVVEVSARMGAVEPNRWPMAVPVFVDT
jgi:HSP20 family protein